MCFVIPLSKTLTQNRPPHKMFHTLNIILYYEKKLLTLTIVKFIIFTQLLPLLFLSPKSVIKVGHNMIELDFSVISF